jgi:Tol biopolymer transport system component
MNWFFRWMVIIMSFTVAQQHVSGKVLKEELFANPLLISAKISPDGNTIAYVGADEKGISNVFISSRDDSTASREQISFFTTSESLATERGEWNRPA